MLFAKLRQNRDSCFQQRVNGGGRQRLFSLPPVCVQEGSKGEHHRGSKKKRKSKDRHRAAGSPAPEPASAAAGAAALSESYWKGDEPVASSSAGKGTA